MNDEWQNEENIVFAIDIRGIGIPLPEKKFPDNAYTLKSGIDIKLFGQSLSWQELVCYLEGKSAASIDDLQIKFKQPFMHVGGYLPLEEF